MTLELNALVMLDLEPNHNKVKGEACFLARRMMQFSLLFTGIGNAHKECRYVCGCVKVGLHIFRYE